MQVKTHELRGRGPCSIVVSHEVANATNVFVPHLTPGAANVIGDWVLRCPAIVVGNDTVAKAFVVDVDDLAAVKHPTWLDYDHPNRRITLAAGAYRHEGHVFFLRDDKPFDEEVALKLHELTSTNAEDLANPFGLAARFVWERWGRARFSSAKAPPMATFMERIAKWAFESGWSDSVWQRVDDDRAAPVFIVDVGRHPSVPVEKRTWREPRSIWNQAWFSTQRCANGLLRYARQIGSRDLEERARQMTEVALSAPQTDGLFPAVLLATDHDDGWRWTNSDRRPATASEAACHIVDAAFTCRMLLEWHTLTGDGRARAYVERFADRLVRLQRPSGAFPGWIEPDGRVCEVLAEGPESAVSVALLFELGMRSPSESALAGVAGPAASRGVAFLERVARDARWEDFETYFSCARWGTPGERIARNGVYKQNTLSIAWCAEAFMLAGRLDLARRCIDELSLYQAVWDPPFLPAPSFGGFGVMNADAEWNDARQSLFAPLYLELGRRTNDRELTERGVAALRASFHMLYCPENAALARAYEARFPFFGPESWGFMMENQGHDVSQPIGTFTIFTWGNGSALASAATVRDRFPELA
jgi:hypothetical protein